MNTTSRTFLIVSILGGFLAGQEPTAQDLLYRGFYEETAKRRFEQAEELYAQAADRAKAEGNAALRTRALWQRFHALQSLGEQEKANAIKAQALSENPAAQTLGWTPRVAGPTDSQPLDQLIDRDGKPTLAASMLLRMREDTTFPTLIRALHGTDPAMVRGAAHAFATNTKWEPIIRAALADPAVNTVALMEGLAQSDSEDAAWLGVVQWALAQSDRRLWPHAARLLDHLAVHDIHTRLSTATVSQMLQTGDRETILAFQRNRFPIESFREASDAVIRLLEDDDVATRLLSGIYLEPQGAVRLTPALVHAARGALTRLLAKEDPTDWPSPDSAAWWLNPVFPWMDVNRETLPRLLIRPLLETRVRPIWISALRTGPLARILVEETSLETCREFIEAALAEAEGPEMVANVLWPFSQALSLYWDRGPMVIDLLDNLSDPTHREELLFQLAFAPAIPEVARRAVTHPSPRIRARGYALFLAMPELASDITSDRLAADLADENSELNTLAAYAAVRLGRPETLPAIRAWLARPSASSQVPMVLPDLAQSFGLPVYEDLEAYLQTSLRHPLIIQRLLSLDAPRAGAFFASSLEDQADLDLVMEQWPREMNPTARNRFIQKALEHGITGKVLAEAVASLPESEVRPALLATWTQGSGPALDVALQWLVSTRPPDVYEALAQRFDDPDQKVREAFRRATLELLAREHLEARVAQAPSPDDQARTRPGIRRLAASTDPVQRRAAAAAIGALGDRTLMTVLVDLAQDDDPDVRKAATAAMESFR